MNRTKNISSKKGNKREELTEFEKGKIAALLELKLYTSEEIGMMVGRSHSVVVRLAQKLGKELIGNSKKSEEYKKRLASTCGELAETLFTGILAQAKTTEGLPKTSPASQAMIAGIATDKLVALTKEKEDPQGQGNVSLNWFQLVQQNTPPRAKDSMAGFVEDVEVVPENKKLEETPKGEPCDEKKE